MSEARYRQQRCASAQPNGAAPPAPEPIAAAGRLKIDNCSGKAEKGLLEISAIFVPSKQSKFSQAEEFHIYIFLVLCHSLP